MDKLAVARRVLLLSGGVVWGLAGCEPQPATQRPVAPAPPREAAPAFCAGAGGAALLARIQREIVLPFGTPVPAENSQVVVQFVVDTGGNILHEKIVHGLSPAVDEAVLTVLQADYLYITREYWPLPQGGKYVQVPCTLTIRAPGVATPAQRREADTRWQRTARRWPGEADSTFVRRVLPRSLAAYEPVRTHAWRPSTFGKQLFFTRSGLARDNNKQGVDLFVLDPFQPDTYAVQVLKVENRGDLTTSLADLCLADLDHDGRQELLALARYSLREEPEVNGQVLAGHYDHFYTRAWHYAGLDPAGRPCYKEDETARPYLDELATSTAVRHALARYQRRAHRRP
jgi:hypothetical protein